MSYDFGGTGYPSLGYTEADFNLYVSYYTTAAQEQELTEAVDALVASFGFTAETTEREKADTIYAWLCQNVTYDYENLNDETYYLKFTAYAALLYKSAVCEGYAVLFYRLAEECGLDARVIAGTAGAQNENHAWNIVQLGDYYYYLDSTWDAGAQPADYEYYLKGHSDFFGHFNEPQFDTDEFRARYPIPAQGLTASSGTVFAVEDWEFVLANGLAIITAYKGNQTEVTIPASFTLKAYVNGVLGDYTFPVHSVGPNVFYQNNTVEKITIEEGITQLRPGAIFGCANLKELHLPATLKMESYGFSTITEVPESCYNLSTLTVAAGNPYLTMINGVLYTADLETLLYCPPKNGVTNLTVPDGVAQIGTSAFDDHATLETLVLPASVKTLGHWALQSTFALKEVRMPGIERIGQYALSLSALQNISIPASAQDIWHGAFFETKLRSITVDAANPTYRMENGILIGKGSALKIALDAQAAHMVIPADVQIMEETAFEDADLIQTVEFPAGLKKIKQSAFSDCDGLTYLSLPAGLETIGGYAFASCDMLVSVIIPASVETIGERIHAVAGQQDNLTIYGEAGSVAQTYANTNGQTFKTLDQWVCDEGHSLEKVLFEEMGNELTDVYHFVCSVCGDHTQRFTEIFGTLDGCTFKIETETFVYNGEAHQPAITDVRDRAGNLLTEGVDYELHYGNNTAVEDNVQIWILPLGRYRVGEYLRYEIQPADLTEAQITVDTPEIEYAGSQVYPEVTVLWKGKTLTKYKDYGILYEGNGAVGTAYAIVSGARNFTGEVRIAFTIKHTHHFGTWMPVDETQHAHQCLDTFCREIEYDSHQYDDACDTECNICHQKREVPHCYTKQQYGNTSTVHWLICDWCGAVNEDSIEGHRGGEATCETLAECTLCGREYGEHLQHQLKQFKDEKYHWTGCENCEYIEYNAKYAHTDSIPPTVCGERKVCDGCGMEFGEPLGHSLIQTGDGTYHWMKCSNCTHTEAKEAHSGGEATCMKKAQCAVCFMDYGEKGGHNFQKAYNERKHYLDCVTPGCNETADWEDHYGGEATCTQRAICKECNQPYGAEPSHSLKLVANPGSLNHYYQCKNCSHTEGGAPHYGGEATCKNKPICDLCHIEYGATIPHSWLDAWEPVQGGHAHPCKWCTNLSAPSPHSGGTATCTKQAECTACGASYGAMASHSMTEWGYKGADGHCKKCAHCIEEGALEPHRAGPAASTQAPQTCLDCGYVLAAQLPTVSFSDVAAGQYYTDAVFWAVANNITTGTGGGKFSPNLNCDRGQVVTFLWRAAGSPEPLSDVNPFSDVKAGDYYYKAVLWAVEQGITGGTGGGKFSPALSCDRGQIVTFLWRAKGSSEPATTVNPFSDVKTGDYYYKAILWAVEKNITGGTGGGKFSPSMTCTRAQVVTFLSRAYN